jgi:hypothetical protein
MKKKEKKEQREQKEKLRLGKKRNFAEKRKEGD